MTWKPFITRLAIFLILLYTIIPAAVLKIGTKPQLTVSVLYMPIIFAGLVAAFILMKKDELKTFKYTFSWKQTILFGILAYALFTAYIVQQKQYWGWENAIAQTITGYALYLIGGLILFLAVFNTDFAKYFKKTILMSFIIIIGYGGGATALSLAGYPITRAIIKPLVALLSLTNTVSLTIDNAPWVTVGDFSAVIGPPCTGITSLILFTGLFLFVVILDWKKINKKALLWMYPVGAVGMFLLAFLRLYLLFLIGANYSSKFAMAGFHNNASWIIFVVYFMAYFWIAYPRMLKKHSTV